jgi:peptide chain release factor 1
MRELIFSATKKDFRVDWFSGSGAGGQYRNKHQNCVRLTHIPTGVVTIGQTERDRPSNMRNAFRQMTKLLVARVLGDERRQRWPGNSETIRTYHEPDNRVVDHLSGHQEPYDIVVHERKLDGMIEARRVAMIEKRIAE